MKSGFYLEMYGTIFTDCFIERSRYANGNLRLSLYGRDANNNFEMAHFADITVENNKIKLSDNEIIVNNCSEPTLITQLKELGIIKEIVSRCIIKDTFYPIYSINYYEVLAHSHSYYKEKLMAV